MNPNITQATLAALLTVSTLVSHAQSTKNQEKLEKLFLEEYCLCMSRDQTVDPQTLLYKTSAECVIEFQQANAELIQKIIREDYPENTTLTEQDRFNESGKRMVRNTTVQFIRSCGVYRTALTKYKAGLIYQLGITQQNAKSSIQELIQKEYRVKEPVDRALYYALLAVMHEFINDKKGALSYYDKALEIHEFSATKALRELLIINGGFKPEQKEEKGTNKL